MRITLTESEIQILFRQHPSTRGDGGFQNLLIDLQSKVDAHTGIIELTQEDLEKIPRYAFDYRNGGWENRLVEVFGRVLGERLGR